MDRRSHGGIEGSKKKSRKVKNSVVKESQQKSTQVNGGHKRQQETVIVKESQGE